jgi:hypothetical protein
VNRDDLRCSDELHVVPHRNPSTDAVPLR